MARKRQPSTEQHTLARKPTPTFLPFKRCSTVFDCGVWTFSSQLTTFDDVLGGQNTPMPTFDPGALLSAVSASGARFYVIGGVVAQVYIPEYATVDLDLLIELASLEKLLAALAPFHPRLLGQTELPPLRYLAQALWHGAVVQIDTDVGQVDLFSSVPGLGTYPAAKRWVKPLRLFGVKVKGLTPQGLLESKVSVGRAKDRPIIARLRELLGQAP